MIQLKKYFLLILYLFIFACSSVPKNTVNACAIFNEKYLWYKFAKSSQRKWGVPIELQMAIIKKESGYDWLARPERTKLFKVIPWKRKSSSLGYSQAIENTWEIYKKSTGKKYVTRVLFKDASDFVGWYVDQTYKKMKVSKLKGNKALQFKAVGEQLENKNKVTSSSNGILGWFGSLFSSKK